jgi:hypothetical protein
MNFEMTPLTFVHVVISLVGIGSGLVVVYGFLTCKRLDGWTAVFLVTTVATSVTGFFFPFAGLTPGLVLGALSLVLLTPTLAGRYVFRLAGAWRPVYVIGSTVALYLNVFVLIVQSFQKVSVLKELAPTQTEPPFAATQLVALTAFVVIGVISVRKFRPNPPWVMSGLISPTSV